MICLGKISQWPSYSKRIKENGFANWFVSSGVWKTSGGCEVFLMLRGKLVNSGSFGKLGRPIVMPVDWKYSALVQLYVVET